jgi:hypothetical protein
MFQTIIHFKKGRRIEAPRFSATRVRSGRACKQQRNAKVQFSSVPEDDNAATRG